MATVIKNAQLTGHRSKPLQSFNLLDYETEARGILAAARKQADLILADAATHAARIREDARALGHREGVDKGLDEGRRAGRDEAFKRAADEFAQQQANLVQVCQKAVTDIDEQKLRLLLAARVDVVKLAMAIARRVVKRLADRPEAAQAIAADNAAEALEMVGPRTDPVLRVNPADAKALEAFARQLVETAHEKRHIRVVPDSSVEPGGCVLTTSEGRVDARLETQLDRIADLLVGEAKEGDETPQ